MQRPSPPPIPVWVGGRSPAALRRVATRGGGWLPMFTSVEQFAKLGLDIDQRLATAGRLPSSVRKGVVVFASLTEPGWTADDSYEWVAGLFPAPIPHLDAYVVTGAAAGIAAKLDAYHVGATIVAAAVASPSPMDMAPELLAAWSSR